MKKATFKLGIPLLSLLGSLYFLCTDFEKNDVNDLVFQNIEALAKSEEDPNENYKCYGYGEIECHGDKVERKTSGFR